MHKVKITDGSPEDRTGLASWGVFACQEQSPKAQLAAALPSRTTIVTFGRSVFEPPIVAKSILVTIEQRGCEEILLFFCRKADIRSSLGFYQRWEPYVQASSDCGGCAICQTPDTSHPQAQLCHYLVSFASQVNHQSFNPQVHQADHQWTW
jgi:hypothetical protein